MSSGYQPRSVWGRWVHEFEKSMIALLLGLMTMVTFINVVLRYLFNESLIWGLEVVLILFAWLVIFGLSHMVKITANLGVDAVTNLLSDRGKKIAALISAAACIFYAVFLLKGAWDYWAPFAALDVTSGKWFPTGFEETRDRAFYMTDQVPMLGIFGFLEDAINLGDPYDKLPRVIPYIILPVGAALLLFRLVQATLRIISGEAQSMIVSHEAEDAVADVAASHTRKES